MYYKIIGFNNSLSIDSSELEKALFIHLTGKTAIFKEGSMSGTSISSIVPDFNKIMGWNEGYKLLAEDHSEIARSKECSEAKKLVEETKEKINYLMETNQQDLIGKNVVIELQKKEIPKEISEGAKSLANIFKVKQDTPHD